MFHPLRNFVFSNKKLTRFYFFLTVFIVVIISSSAYSENLLRGPQNFHKTTPDVRSKNSDCSLDIYNKIISAPVIFYQKCLAPYWGHRCSHHPSCSRYSLLTIKKHGVIIGFVMTFDRLQHESNEARYSPLIKINGETKVYDPVENNDFWWHKK